MTSALANLVPGPYRAPTLRRFPDDFLNPVPPSNTPQDVSHYPISSRAPPHTPHHTTGIEPSWDTNIQIAPLSCCDRVRTTTPPCTVTLLDVTKHVMALPPPHTINATDGESSSSTTFTTPPPAVTALQPPTFSGSTTFDLVAIANQDITQYVRERSPPDEDVYSVCRVSRARGPGLDALPNTRTGRVPAVSYALLVRLAIVGSPSRCLTGQQLLEAIHTRFRDIKSRDGKDWKVSSCTQGRETDLLLITYNQTGVLYVLRSRAFNCVPAPSYVPDLARIWYNDASNWPPSNAPFRTPGERRRLTQIRASAQMQQVVSTETRRRRVPKKPAHPCEDNRFMLRPVHSE